MLEAAILAAATGVGAVVLGVVIYNLVQLNRSLTRIRARLHNLHLDFSGWKDEALSELRATRHDSAR